MKGIRFLKLFLPLLVATFVFYYLFRKYPLSRIAVGLPYIQLPLFFIISIIYFLSVWWLDCWGLARFFSRVGYSTGTRELCTPRLASYLIMVISYAVSQGILAWFFKKEKNLPFLKSTSLISFVILIDLYWMITLSFVSSYFSGSPLERWNFLPSLRILWVCVTAGMAIWAVFGQSLSKYKLLNWTRRFHILSAFQERKLSDYLYTMLIRFPLHVLVNSSLFFFAWTFGVYIPLIEVITYLPIVLLLGTLPLTPAGLGISQLVMVAFFADKVQGEIVSLGQISGAELIVLISLTAQVMNLFLKGITGVFFLRRVLSSTTVSAQPQSNLI